MRAWLVDRMPAAVQTRITLGGRELGLIALVGAVALCAVAGIALKASAGAATPVTAKPPLVAATLPARGRPTAPLIAPRSGARTTVVVDVAGAVVHPRVVTLPAGARVFEALKAAGGVRRGVDVSALNLARVLVDGEQIVVGRSTAPASVPVTSAPSSSGPSGPVVSLNRATEAELEGLPGIGPVTAKSIVAWRQQHGPFTKVDELQEVDGIGPKTFAKLKPLVQL